MKVSKREKGGVQRVDTVGRCVQDSKGVDRIEVCLCVGGGYREAELMERDYKGRKQCCIGVQKKFTIVFEVGQHGVSKGLQENAGINGSTKFDRDLYVLTGSRGYTRLLTGFNGFEQSFNGFRFLQGLQGGG